MSPGPPADSMKPEPTTPFTLSDIRDLLRYKRERAEFDARYRAMMAAQGPTMSATRAMNLAYWSAYNTPQPGRLTEDRAASLPAYRMLVKAACNEYRKDLDEDTLRLLVAEVADRWSRTVDQLMEMPLDVFGGLLEATARSHNENPTACGGNGPAEQEAHSERHDGIQQVTSSGFQPAAQDAVHHGLATIDEITVSPDGRWVEITGLSCKVVPGSTPTACPDARPVLPPSVLPAVERAIRQFYRHNPLPDGATIHWVGHDTGYRSRCKCHPAAPFAAPFDQPRWASVVRPNQSVVQAAPVPISTQKEEESPHPEAVEGQTPAPKSPTLNDRRKLILVEMLALNAVGSRNKVTRAQVVVRIDKKKMAADFARDFGALKDLGYTDSGVGPDGGVWLTASGKKKAEE